MPYWDQWWNYLAAHPEVASAIDVVGRLTLAIMAAAAVGMEREFRRKPAGLRTHMLVSLGAAMIMISAIDLCRDVPSSATALRLDPIGAISGIVGGIGFLGAGSILKDHDNIHGITTAASIWVAAAIGICCGIGEYFTVIAGVILALIILVVLAILEDRVLDTKNETPPSAEPHE